MKIYCLRHVAFEGPGVITHWAAKNNHDLVEIRIFDGEPFPAIDQIDALVIMGGPMSAYDNYDWLKEEKTLIGKAVVQNIPILGICLGAQLLADVLKAKIYPNKEKEIGWFPVIKTNDGIESDLIADWPDSWTTFHWHGDTFDLPAGANHLIQSEACVNQAFQFGKAIGLQFHMEMTEVGIADVSERCAHEFVDAPYIQERKALRNSPHMEPNHTLLAKFLDRWIRL